MATEAKLQSQVNYLMKAASLLPSDNHFQKILRSYYLTKCKRLSQTVDGSKIPLSEDEMCRKCSTPWIDADYSLSIAPIPATKRQSQKIHRQIEKRSKRKNQVAKKLSKIANNRVTIKCNLCDIKNKVILWKKTQTRDLSKLNEMNESNNMVLTEVKPVESEPPRTKKAKKKRNKDINAGLLYSLQKDTNSVKTLVNINQKLQTLNIEKTKSTPIQPKITLQQSKKNSPKPPKQSILNPKKSSCKIVKNISQPMGKRSNLLQLANALKSKGYQSNSKSSADKLKQLLK